MQKKTFIVNPHPRGTWTADYEKDGVAGYERYAVVRCGTENLSVAMSLKDANTAETTDETAWMMFSDYDKLKDYCDTVAQQVLDDYVNSTETVTVNLSMSDNQNDTEVEVKIVADGETIDTLKAQSKGGSVTFRIKAGTQYSIVLPDITMYHTPTVQNAVAQPGGVRTFTLEYVRFTIGVYIALADRSLVSPDEYTPDGTAPDGVYVDNGEINVVIALADIGSYTWATSGTAAATTLIEGIATDTDYADGQSLMEVARAFGGGSLDDFPAFKACDEYTFPSGRKGYLGAAGEWKKLVMPNLTEINSALAKAGGTSVSGNHWTGTQNLAPSAYVCNGSQLSNFSKPNSNAVRAFSAF